MEPPREKGIDVALAVDVVRLAIEGAYEVGIVFSRDTDLLPAIEAVRGLRDGPHIEVATWQGQGALRLPGAATPLYCHYLSEQDFHAVRDTRRYVI